MLFTKSQKDSSINEPLLATCGYDQEGGSQNEDNDKVEGQELQVNIQDERQTPERRQDSFQDDTPSVTVEDISESNLDNLNQEETEEKQSSQYSWENQDYDYVEDSNIAKVFIEGQIQGDTSTDENRLANLREKIDQLEKEYQYKKPSIQTHESHFEHLMHRHSSYMQQSETKVNYKDAQNRLRELGNEHAQRDATTMLWQCQMKTLSEYLPETKLENDVIFHAGDVLICEQQQEPDPKQIGMFLKSKMRSSVFRPTNKHLENNDSPGIQNGCFREYLSLLRIKLKKVMDIQHQTQNIWPVDRDVFTRVEIMKIDFEEPMAFSRFHGRYKCIMQQECSSQSAGRFFEVVTDGGMLYFWKFERFLEWDAPNPQNKGKSVFKLYRLNMDNLKNQRGKKNLDLALQFIRELVIEDTSEKMALSLGFLRNQSQIEYSTEQYLDNDKDREKDFLADQILVVKYVCLPNILQSKNLATAKVDDCCRQVHVSIRPYDDFDRELSQYQYQIGDRFQAMRTLVSYFTEGPQQLRSTSSKMVLEQFNMKRKLSKGSPAKTLELQSKITNLMQQSIQQKWQRSKEKSAVIIFRNNILNDYFAVGFVDKEAEGSKSGLYRQQYNFRVSVGFKAKLVRTFFNNCYVTLYDKEMERFFFRRCDPVVASKRKSLMILDSIFGKIITFNKEQPKNGSKVIFTMQSRLLENYGKVYDVLQPFKLGEEFPHFLNCHKKSDLTTFIALEVTRMSMEQQHSHHQLLINKMFSNIARKDEKIIIWNDMINLKKTDSPMFRKKNRTIEIIDTQNSVPQLNLYNVTVISDEKLITNMRVQRGEETKPEKSFLSLRKERKKNFKKKSTMKIGNAKSTTIINTQTKPQLQVDAGPELPVIFVQVDGKLQIQEEVGEINRFRRRTSLFNPVQDMQQFSSDYSRTTSKTTFTQSKTTFTHSKTTLMPAVSQQTSTGPLTQNTLKKSKSMRDLAAPKMKQNWQIIYERVCFTDDTRTQRPLILYQTIRNERSKLLEIQFWLCVFDFKTNQIVNQKTIWFPELELKYEPQSICLSASTEQMTMRDDPSTVYQSFQVSIGLAHQRRVKIIEYTLYWKNLSKESQDLDTEVEIYHTGTLELILRKDARGEIDDLFTPQLLPLLDQNNDIEGTQLVFPSNEQCPTTYYFANKMKIKNTSASLNPLLQKQGYQLFRNKEDFQLDAVMAYAQIKTNLIQGKDALMTYEDASSIVEQSIRVVLNSVVFDPMAPIYPNLSIKYLLHNSIGRSFESLDWYSPLSVKGVKKELECLLIYEKPEDYTIFERIQAAPFCSLIERVMHNDLSLFKNETIIIDDEYDMNFNRIETFVNDKLLYKPQEIIQRDWWLNSSLHYLFEQDNEMDLILSKVFKNWEDGILLPEAQAILKSMTLKFIRRKNPLALFHKFFLTQTNSIDDKTKIDNDKLGETMNLAQQIRGKMMPKKQNEKLQVFTPKFTEHQSSLRIEQLVSQYLEEQKRQDNLAEGLDYKVYTYIIDLRSAFLEDKMEWIKCKAANHRHHHEDPLPLQHFTKYYLAEMVNQIQQSPACDLDDEVLLRNLIDYQWLDTQMWQYRFFALYIGGYLVPFFIQIFQKDQRIVILCNLSCFFTMLFFFAYEFMQYYKTTFTEYIEDFWNKVDVAHISMYGLCYFWLRIARSEGTIADFFEYEKTTPAWSPDYNKVYYMQITLTWTNIILMFLAVMKLLNFLRIFESFGLFILLIGQCISDIKLFFAFMMLWLCVFTLMFYILKSDIPNYKDYPHLWFWQQQLIQVWRNALGDLQPPDYTFYWGNDQKRLNELREDHSFRDATTKNIDAVQISLWIIWFIMTLFNQVIMLNFMIAIISNSYENVMRRKYDLMFSYKCDLNREVAIFISYFERFCVIDKSNFNSIVIVTDLDAEQDDEWTGMASKARALVNRLLVNQRYYLDQNDSKMKKLMGEQVELQNKMEAMYESNKNMMKAQVQDMNQEISGIADIVQDMHGSYKIVKKMLIRSHTLRLQNMQKSVKEKSKQDLKKSVQEMSQQDQKSQTKKLSLPIEQNQETKTHIRKFSHMIEEKEDPQVVLPSDTKIFEDLRQKNKHKLNKLRSMQSTKTVQLKSVGDFLDTIEEKYDEPVTADKFTGKKLNEREEKLMDSQSQIIERNYEDSLQDFDYHHQAQKDLVGFFNKEHFQLKSTEPQPVLEKSNSEKSDSLNDRKGGSAQPPDLKLGSESQNSFLKSKTMGIQKLNSVDLNSEGQNQPKKPLGLFGIIENMDKKSDALSQKDLNTSRQSIIQMMQQPLLNRAMSMTPQNNSQNGQNAPTAALNVPMVGGNPMMNLMFKKMSQGINQQMTSNQGSLNKSLKEEGKKSDENA